MIDKKYLINGVTSRMEQLQARYYMYCNGVNENGDDLSYQAAANARSLCQHDIEVLKLVAELAVWLPEDYMLSTDGQPGYEKLCEPMERKRQYRNRQC